MPRKKNDGRGRLGGRQAGTPNRDNPLKTILHEHSLAYFTPSLDEHNDLGEKTGRTISQYEQDLSNMKPVDRVNAELALLKYHTPQMQAVSADMSIKTNNLTLAQRLSRLAKGDTITPDEQ